LIYVVERVRADTIQVAVIPYQIWTTERARVLDGPRTYVDAPAGRCWYTTDMRKGAVLSVVTFPRDEVGRWWPA
jgi:hypothetical protein